MKNKTYPPEFRADVIAMARKGEIPKKQLAENVGISEQTLYRWLRIADRDEGRRQDGITSAEQDELRQLRKTNRRLEQENEILRRAAAYFAKDALPK